MVGGVGKGGSYETEILIEIKQLYFGQMAANPFIAGHRRYRMFPLRDHFIIENGLLD